MADFGVDCFFLLRLSIVSSGRGKIMGGPKLCVRGHGKSTLRGTVSEVVVFMRRGPAGSASFIVDLVRLSRTIGSESSLSLTSMSPTGSSLRTDSS